MNQSRGQFQLSLVWADSDLHEVVVHASSKHFSGETSIYMAPGELADLADLLNEFPSTREDKRTFELGQSDLRGYGKVRGTLYCRDSTGHLGFHVEVFHSPSDPTDKPESCAVLLCVVPSDLDRFLAELRRIGEHDIQVATLANAA